MILKYRWLLAKSVQKNLKIIKTNENKNTFFNYNSGKINLPLRLLVQKYAEKSKFKENMNYN